MWTDDLDDYKKMKETDSCYLDGRYFNKVFINYPGLLYNSLNIRINKEDKFYIHMHQQNVNTEYPGILRIIITTPKTRHSNLLILDYENNIVYRFEPLGKNAPHFDKINELVEDYLSFFFEFKLSVVDVNLDLILDEKNSRCLEQGERTGFCNAYIILYTYAWLNKKEFDPRNIRRFAKKIESNYGTLPLEGAERDYGFLSGGPVNPQPQNVLIGGLGGAAIGGLAGGGTGALIGGLGGGLLGSLV